MRSTRILVPLAAALFAMTACSTDDAGDPAPTTSAPQTDNVGTDAVDETGAAESTPSEVAGAQRFPDVIDADAELEADAWTISATLSSPYDTPERYADAWRVVGPDGTVYGERILTHDHAGEQPFTRSESGIEIPDDVAEVVIEGRDLEYGYGGATFTLVLSR